MDSLEKERERKGIQYDIFSGSLQGLVKRKSCRWTLFRWQGGFYLPQRSGSQHGDLKKAAAGRFRGLSDILPAVFVYGNLLISHSPYS